MKYIIIIALMILSLCGFSQTGDSYSTIIAQKGKPNKSEYIKGFLVLTYLKNYESETSGEYECLALYFFNSENICDKMYVMEPYTEMNKWVRLFNKKYVAVGNMTWVDYARNVQFSLEVDYSDKKFSHLNLWIKAL